MAGSEGIWKGYDPNCHFFRDTAPPSMSGEEEGLGKRGDQWTEVLSWEPRAFLFHNFLSQEECQYIVNLAESNMTKSLCVDRTGKGYYDSSLKNSTSMFLKRGEDKIIKDIEKRIADYTFIPVEHGEGLQVIHYAVGQKVEPHYDSEIEDLKNGCPRIATLIMYLTNVEEGGETYFPSAKGNTSWVPWWNDLSESGDKGLYVKPKMGDALLFWTMKPDVTIDKNSVHGGKPVIKGNKWMSIKILHLKEYKEQDTGHSQANEDEQSAGEGSAAAENNARSKMTMELKRLKSSVNYGAIKLKDDWTNNTS